MPIINKVGLVKSTYLVFTALITQYSNSKLYFYKFLYKKGGTYEFNNTNTYVNKL